MDIQIYLVYFRLSRCYGLVSSCTITLSILLMSKDFNALLSVLLLLCSPTVVTTFITSRLCDAVQNVMDKELCGNETSNYELELRTKTNEVRYLRMNVTTR